jgi:predicted RNA-binding Zn ribbon-like protein
MDLQERAAAQAKQVSGRLCLNFVNLVGGWRRVETREGGGTFEIRDERLSDYLDVAAWALGAGLVGEPEAKRLVEEADRRPDEASRVHRRAVRLRAAIHSVASRLEASLAPSRESLDTLSDEIARARSRQRLVGGSPNLVWKGDPGAATLDFPLAEVALSAEEFFTRADLSRLHTCPGDDCGWLFEDTTKNRSRRWCDMGDCGNKAKVREFRSRRPGKPARV